MGSDGKETRDVNALLPLTPAVFHILLALVDQEKHGYAIMQEVDKFTGGQFALGPGTLYRSIQRMMADGLIEETERDDPGDDERRRYYRLTPFGIDVARAESQRLALLVGMSRRKGLLPPKG